MSTRQKAQLVNPALLKWARESAGYSVGELAASIQRKPGDIASWESGEDAPSFAQLRRLAGRVKRSVAVFYLPAVPAEPPLPRDFRCRADPGVGGFGPSARLAFRELRNALSNWAEIAGLAGEPVSVDLPSASLVDDPEVTASVLRTHIGVSVDEQLDNSRPYAAMDLWTDALFALGVLVQRSQMDTSELRAFSLTHAGLAGIGLSTKDAPTARVFSLLHEVAHLCLGQPGVSGDSLACRDLGTTPEAHVERHCDAVAGEFLMPRRSDEVAVALQSLRRNLDYDSARQCGDQFGVSRFVVARRMLDLKLLEPDVYWETVEGWLKRKAASERSGPGGNYYNNKLSEIGKPFAAAVIEAVDRGFVSTHTALMVLGVKTATTLQGLRQRLAG